jgi:hypothetical protein
MAMIKNDSEIAVNAQQNVEVKLYQAL